MRKRLNDAGERPTSLRRSFAKEVRAARAINYTAACDYTHLLLMADIAGDPRLLMAAAAVRRANLTVWLKSREAAIRAIPRPVLRPKRRR